MEKIYGIDLGTTNSLIGYHDTLYTGLVPSVANIKAGMAGDIYKEEFGEEFSRSFKVDMSLGDEGKEPVMASSLVLKALCNRVPEEVKKVVISVPAYFTDNERQATIKAANIAGLEVAGIVNEPTAAALYYCRNDKKLALVYDLGGGTFDVTAIDSRYGFFDVVANDGLKIGGDDLDAAIRNYLIKKNRVPIHKLAKGALRMIQAKCEKLKVQIQKTGQTASISLKEFGIDMDLELTVQEYKDIVAETFKKTFVLMEQVVSRAVDFGDNFELLLVGGSTRCPYLREMIEEKLGVKAAPLTYDPDRIVAQGACLYAQMLENDEVEANIMETTQQLSIGLDDGSVKVIILKDSKIPIKESVLMTNSQASKGISLKLYQGDSLLESNNKFIGELLYDFENPVDKGTASVDVSVEVTIDGLIKLSAKEPLRPVRELVLRR